MDRTADFRKVVQRHVDEHFPVGDDARARFANSLLLKRRLRRKTLFTVAASELGHQIWQASSALDSCKREFTGINASALSDEVRDRLEVELGGVIRVLTQGLDKLQEKVTIPDYVEEEESTSATGEGKKDPSSAVASSSPPPKRKGTHPKRTNTRPRVISPQEAVHRQGTLLILSEKIHALSTDFDDMKREQYEEQRSKDSAHAQALEILRLNRRPDQSKKRHASQHTEDKPMDRVLGQGHGPPSSGVAGGTTSSYVLSSSEVSCFLPPPPEVDDGTGWAAQAQAEVMLVQSSIEDSMSTITEAEASLREVSTLTQVMNEQALKQLNQIEQVYYDALAASHSLLGGAKELEKTLRVAGKGRRWLTYLMVSLSLSLLVADWWFS